MHERRPRFPFYNGSRFFIKPKLKIADCCLAVCFFAKIIFVQNRRWDWGAVFERLWSKQKERAWKNQTLSLSSPWGISLFGNGNLFKVAGKVGIKALFSCKVKAENMDSHSVSKGRGDEIGRGHFDR